MARFTLDKDQLALVIQCINIGYESVPDGLCLDDYDYDIIEAFFTDLETINNQGCGATITIEHQLAIDMARNPLPYRVECQYGKTGGPFEPIAAFNVDRVAIEYARSCSRANPFHAYRVMNTSKRPAQRAWDHINGECRSCTVKGCERPRGHGLLNKYCREHAR